MDDPSLTWPAWGGAPAAQPATPSLGSGAHVLQQGPQLPWGYTAVREGLLTQWELIYQDHSVKDVEVVLKDGLSVMADSLVLKVSSPVFRAMLTHELQEKREMKFIIDDYTAAEFRFFLRLMYTGRMDPAEWPDEQAEDQPPGSPVSQPPATAHPVLPFDCRQVDPDLGLSARAWSSLMAAQAAEGGTWGQTRRLARKPPVDLLLACAALSKRYQVDWLLCVLVDVVKRRITEASFESILLAAMAHDIAPVRLGALEFARRSQEVRWRYDTGEFPHEIIFELQAAFPTPPAALCESSTFPI